MSALSQRPLPTMPLGKLMPDCFDAAEHSIEIDCLASDSRKVTPNSLYFAVKNQLSNQLEYLDQALESGAKAWVTDDESLYVDMQRYAIPSCFDQAMGARVSEVAATYFDQPSLALEVVGITGTNGKTSCCFWLSWLFNQAGIACGQIGTLGFQANGLDADNDPSEALRKTGFTTPDPIQTQQLLAECRDADAQAVVMEVSSHGLAQDRVKAVQFRSAIFTNLSQDHLDYHQTFANYLSAKLKLFQREELGCAVVNLDDRYSDDVIEAVASQAKVYTYGLRNPAANLYFSDIQHVTGGYQVRLHCVVDSINDVHLDKQANLCIPVFGEYNLSNLLAVSAVALAHSVKFETLINLLSVIPAVPGRLERISSVDQMNMPDVFVDFAHTPEAVNVTLSALRLQTQGKLIAVLGCGGNRDSDKRPLMAKAASAHSDRQIFTSDNPRSEVPEQILQQMIGGVPEEKRAQCKLLIDRRQAILEAIQTSVKGDLVVVLGRGHETHQEIMGKKIPFHDPSVCAELIMSVQEGQGLPEAANDLDGLND